jgi:hypothetical protein
MSYSVWLYYRLALGPSDVEALLSGRGAWAHARCARLVSGPLDACKTEATFGQRLATVECSRLIERLLSDAASFVKRIAH